MDSGELVGKFALPLMDAFTSENRLKIKFLTLSSPLIDEVSKWADDDEDLESDLLI